MRTDTTLSLTLYVTWTTHSRQNQLLSRVIMLTLTLACFYTRSMRQALLQACDDDDDDDDERRRRRRRTTRLQRRRRRWWWWLYTQINSHTYNASDYRAIGLLSHTDGPRAITSVAIGAITDAFSPNTSWMCQLTRPAKREKMRRYVHHHGTTDQEDRWRTQCYLPTWYLQHVSRQTGLLHRQHKPTRPSISLAAVSNTGCRTFPAGQSPPRTFPAPNNSHCGHFPTLFCRPRTSPVLAVCRPVWNECVPAANLYEYSFTGGCGSNMYTAMQLLKFVLETVSRPPVNPGKVSK